MSVRLVQTLANKYGMKLHQGRQETGKRQISPRVYTSKYAVTESSCCAAALDEKLENVNRINFSYEPPALRDYVFVYSSFHAAEAWRVAGGFNLLFRRDEKPG